MTQLTQDEIVSSTKTVISGLESLKLEHHAGLQTLETSLKAVSQESNGDIPLISEKSEILHKSLEMIDIGIEEAKVKLMSFKSCWKRNLKLNCVHLFTFIRLWWRLQHICKSQKQKNKN